MSKPKSFTQKRSFLIVSLGTGDHTAKFLLENIKSWGVSQWIKPIFDLFLNGQCEIVDHQLRGLLQTPGDQLGHYFRLQLRLLENEIPVDDARPIQLHVLNLAASEVIRENASQIEEICKLLAS